MLIGNLPKVDKIDEDTLVVVSQTGSTAQTTEAKNLALGGGKGLKYWVEDETSIKRIVDVEGSIDFDTKYMVPGKAKMMVEVVRKKTQSIDELKAYYSSLVYFAEFTQDPETGYWIAVYVNPADPEHPSSITIEHDPDDHIAQHTPLRYYYLERQSDKPVMGGGCCYKYWGDLGEGSRLPEGQVKWSSEYQAESTHNYYVRGWCLISTNKLDLVYDFIEEDALTGDKLTLQTVTALDTGYTFGDVTLYVNGYVDPELYESHALWNTAVGDVGGYAPVPPSGVPVEYYYDVDEDEEYWAGSWFYLDDRWESGDPVHSAPLFMPTKPTRSGYDSQDGIRFVSLEDPRSQWINETYTETGGVFGSSTPLKDIQLYSIKWLGNKTYGEYGSQYEDADYEFFGPPLPWLGCVVNIADVPYTGLSGHHKDAIDYFYHDADIKEAYYYYTGIDSGLGEGGLAFYTGLNTGEAPGEGDFDPSGKYLRAYISRQGTGKFDKLYLDAANAPLVNVTALNAITPAGNSNINVASFDISDSGELTYIKAPKTVYTPVVTSGTKIGTLSCAGETTDIYAPNGGSGGGSNVSFTQTRTAGDEIGKITIDGTDTKLYGYISDQVDVTPVYNSGIKVATIDINRSNGGAYSKDIYIPNSSGFGYASGSITEDPQGNDLTTQGGPYSILVNNLKSSYSAATNDFVFTKGVWQFDAMIRWKLHPSTIWAAYRGQEYILFDITSKNYAGNFELGQLEYPKNQYPLTAMYAGASGIVVDIPLSSRLIVAANQSGTPSFGLRITHGNIQDSYVIDRIDWFVSVHRIGDY